MSRQPFSDVVRHLRGIASNNVIDPATGQTPELRGSIDRELRIDHCSCQALRPESSFAAAQMIKIIVHKSTIEKAIHIPFSGSRFGLLASIEQNRTRWRGVTRLSFIDLECVW